MTYEAVRDFSASWGLIYFIAMFVVVLIYALSPKNKAGFERAARLPLTEDSEDDRQA